MTAVTGENISNSPFLQAGVGSAGNQPSVPAANSQSSSERSTESAHTSSLVRHTLREAGGGRNREHLVEASWRIIAEGSKSFAAASMLFDLTTREQVWMLYAWCRRCDDLIDGQQLGGALDRKAGLSERVKALRVLTRAALNRQPTAEVAFDAYGQVASETGLTLDDAEEVIAGFELDEQDWRPRTEDDMMRYCYYVAGAVGLMMGIVMGVDREDTETLDQAVDLGISFQLANIARDVLEDDAAGRCYLPLDWLVEQDIEPGQHTKPHHREELAEMAARLIDLMELHQAHARLGIEKLTFRQRWAIMAAMRIYGDIGQKVREAGTQAWNGRIHTTGWEKLRHVAGAFRDALDNWPPPDPPPGKRWTRDRLKAH